MVMKEQADNSYLDHFRVPEHDKVEVNHDYVQRVVVADHFGLAVMALFNSAVGHSLED